MSAALRRHSVIRPATLVLPLLELKSLELRLLSNAPVAPVVLVEALVEPTVLDVESVEPATWSDAVDELLLGELVELPGELAVLEPMSEERPESVELKPVDPVDPLVELDAPNEPPVLSVDDAVELGLVLLRLPADELPGDVEDALLPDVPLELVDVVEPLPVVSFALVLLLPVFEVGYWDWADVLV